MIRIRFNTTLGIKVLRNSLHPKLIFVLRSKVALNLTEKLYSSLIFTGRNYLAIVKKYNTDKNINFPKRFFKCIT